MMLQPMPRRKSECHGVVTARVRAASVMNVAMLPVAKFAYRTCTKSTYAGRRKDGQTKIAP